MLKEISSKLEEFSGPIHGNFIFHESDYYIMRLEDYISLFKSDSPAGARAPIQHWGHPTTLKCKNAMYEKEKKVGHIIYEACSCLSLLTPWIF